MCNVPEEIMADPVTVVVETESTENKLIVAEKESTANKLISKIIQWVEKFKALPEIVLNTIFKVFTQMVTMALDSFIELKRSRIVQYLGVTAPEKMKDMVRRIVTPSGVQTGVFYLLNGFVAGLLDLQEFLGGLQKCLNTPISHAAIAL